MELLTVLTLWLAIAPPPDVSLDDLRAFPPYSVAKDITQATWKLHREWECQPPLCLTVEVRDARRDATRDAWKRWYVWDDLRLAADTDHTLEYRLSVLRRMRQWLGDEAYYHGEMPPPVPWGRVWR